MITFKSVTASVLLLTLALLLAVNSVNASSRCDKSCLLAVTEQFLEVKTSGSVKDLHTTNDVRASSNSRVVQLGKGETWQAGISIVNRHTFVDPKTQTAIFFGTIVGKPQVERQWWHYSVRLTANKDGALTEIEEQANANGFTHPSELAVPFREVAIFDPVLPADEQTSEAELINVVNKYWDALQSGKKSTVPLSPDCQRTNMGTLLTNNPSSLNRKGDPNFVPEPQIGRSCGGYFDNPRFRYKAVNRRFYVVDVPRGVVVGAVQFEQIGEDGSPALTIIEAFKIANGRIKWLWGPSLNWNGNKSGWPDWNRPL